VGVVPEGHGECPGQPEVGQLDDAVVVEEQVLGLQVAVENPAGVAVGDAVQQLAKVALKIWENNDWNVCLSGRNALRGRVLGDGERDEF